MTALFVLYSDFFPLAVAVLVLDLLESIVPPFFFGETPFDEFAVRTDDDLDTCCVRERTDLVVDGTEPLLL